MRVTFRNQETQAVQHTIAAHGGTSVPRVGEQVDLVGPESSMWEVTRVERVVFTEEMLADQEVVVWMRRLAE